MKKTYNVHEWADEDALKHNKIFIHNYFLSGDEFPGWQMRDASPEKQPADAFQKEYVWFRSSDEIFKVQVIEGYSYEVAKRCFQELLQQHMRPLDQFDKVEDLFGRDAYVDHQDDMHYGVFLLGNMVIEVHNVSTQPVSCNNFIKHLFFIMNGIPEPTAIPEQHVEIFEARPVISAGETTELNIQPPVWYKLMLDGPGKLGFRYGKLQYLSEEPGAARIDLYAIRKETVVKSTVTITVN